MMSYLRSSLTLKMQETILMLRAALEGESNSNVPLACLRFFELYLPVLGVPPILSYWLAL